MDDSSSIQIKYWDATLKEAKLTKHWFTDDDFLLRVKTREDTLVLLAVLEYGNDPTELIFEGVTNWRAKAELKAGKACMVTGAKLEKVGELKRLTIQARDSSRIGKRIVTKTVPLLEITFQRCFYRDIDLLAFDGHEYRGMHPNAGNRAAIAILVMLAIVALIFFLAYLNKQQ